jgi:acetyl-CoA C-acetyltransferase
MQRFGTTRKQLAAVAVKNHANGLLNPNAQYRMKVSLEDVLNATLVADPLGLLDCSPITDGAAALVLASVEKARALKPGRPLVKITGSGMATDTITLANRVDLAALPAVKLAADRAYAMAGRKPSDLHVVEVHDCFSIAEIMATEALGLFPPGQGGPAVERGTTAIGGAIPVNPSGGLKSKGHPVGATGVSMHVVSAMQLTGTAGDFQKEGAELGCVFNMGGSGVANYCSILERRN